jgi:cytoskeletal protein RodZ
MKIPTKRPTAPEWWTDLSPRDRLFLRAILGLGVAFTIMFAVTIWTFVDQQSTNTSIVTLANQHHADSTRQSTTNRSLISRVDADQSSDTSALCSLRADVKQRVSSGKAFLKTHPDGILGISAASLQSSVTNSQHTVTALASLVCPK